MSPAERLEALEAQQERLLGLLRDLVVAVEHLAGVEPEPEPEPTPPRPPCRALHRRRRQGGWRR